MKIGMVLDRVFPPDLRVENEAVSLVEAGHDVHLLCLTHKKNDKNFEIYRGIKLHKVYASSVFIKKMRALTNTIINIYTHFWAKQIKNFARTNLVEVLHIHDLYLLGATFMANKKVKLPVVADLHENYVDGLNHYAFANTFPGNILISKKKWTQTEIDWCKTADHVITVIDEAIDRYKSLGLPEEKISVVANYVNEDDFLNDPDDVEIINRFKGKFIASYIGGFDVHRGLEIVMKSLPEIVKVVPNFLLILVGSGKNIDFLKAMAKSLNVKKHVAFEGYQNPTKIPSYIKASTVCLIPHLKTVHTDNTIPHKLFHYMLLEKPIVASNCKPIERIVNDTKTGLIYESNNANQLAEKIIALYQNKDLIVEMGKNGVKAVKEKYNWSQTSINLINLYKNLDLHRRSE